MSDETHQPPTEKIVYVTAHSKLYPVLIIIALILAGIAFLTWQNRQVPQDAQKEIAALKTLANHRQDSMAQILRKRDSTIAYLTVITAYVDTQKIYIRELEHSLAQKELGLKQDNKKFDDQKKAVANETDMERIKKVKEWLNH